jgi:hypothetical protein
MRGAGTALLLLMPLFAGAENTAAEKVVLVEAVGEGRAPLKQPGDLAKARRVALVAAKRDAVESAFGAYVSLEKGPGLERIYAASLAAIREYTVEEEREEKGFYYTRIRARIPVPEKYLAADDPPDAPAAGFQPLVEKFPWGEIDWQAGTITARGEGRLQDSGHPEQDRLKAQRAAVVDAKGNMLKMIFKIRINADMTVADKASDQEISIRLEGFIRGAESRHETAAEDTGLYRVTLEAPVHGVRGLSAIFLDDGTGRAGPDRAPEGGKALTETYTLIIFDARGTGLQPALFPRVLDREGKEVFSIRTVWRDSAVARGMAAYAVLEAGEPILSGDRIASPAPRLGPAAASCSGRDRPLWIEALGAAAREGKRVRRRGFNPVVVDTEATGGKLAANLVISREDAERLEKIDGETHLLKDCRVLIIKESAVGGIEGLLIAGSAVHPKSIPDSSEL